MVAARTKELGIAQANLARYIDIVDRYVISSQTDLNGVIIETQPPFVRYPDIAKRSLLVNRTA